MRLKFLCVLLIIGLKCNGQNLADTISFISDKVEFNSKTDSFGSYSFKCNENGIVSITQTSYFNFGKVSFVKTFNINDVDIERREFDYNKKKYYYIGMNCENKNKCVIEKNADNEGNASSISSAGIYINDEKKRNMVFNAILHLKKHFKNKKNLFSDK